MIFFAFFFAKKFAYIKNLLYLCTVIQKKKELHKPTFNKPNRTNVHN